MNKKKKRAILQLAVVVGCAAILMTGILLLPKIQDIWNSELLETLPVANETKLSEAEEVTGLPSVDISLQETEAEETFAPVHDKNGVWIAYDSRKSNENQQKSRQQTLLYATDEGILHPLRMYGNDIYGLTFYNDTEAEVQIYFYVSSGMAKPYTDANSYPPNAVVPGEIEIIIGNENNSQETASVTAAEDEQDTSLDDATDGEEGYAAIQYAITVRPGESQRLELMTDENKTVSYTLAIVTSESCVAYAADDEQLQYINTLPMEGKALQLMVTGSRLLYRADTLYMLPQDCSLIWAEKDVTGEYVAQNSNAAFFNGENLLDTYGIGGDPNVMLQELVLTQRDNAWLTVSTLSYEKYNNIYRIYLPYEIGEASLTAARFSYQFNGEVSFSGEGCNPDGTFNLLKPVYCKLTDAEGRSHSYLLIADRDKNKLPVVYITTSTGNDVTSKNTYISGTFRMDADHVDGIDSIEQQSIRIRGRGHSTWKVSKKSYALKFDSKVSILGLENNRDWVLLANYFDPSMTRNYIAYEMARTLSFDFVPTTYPVDVFFNGVYVGVYCIGDKIEVARGRVELNEDNTSVDCDYLLEIGGYDSGFFNVGLLKGVSIKCPDTDVITPEQRSYISGYMQEANNAVVNLTNYEDYIDMDSFLDWFILTEFTYNCDAGFFRSVFITKKAGGKLEFQPVWDYDLSMGNLSNLTPEYESWATTQNAYIDITWATYLLQDKHFMDLLEQRWKEVRDRMLKAGIQACHTMRGLLEDSGDKNFEMWVEVGTILGWEWQFMADFPDVDTHIDYLEGFLEMHANFLDRAIIKREPVTPYIPPAETEAPPETEVSETPGVSGTKPSETDPIEASEAETLDE